MLVDEQQSDVVAGLLAQMLDELERIAEELAGAPVRFASIRLSAAGDTTLVADVVGRIQVVSYLLVAGNAVDVLWRSGGRPISGVLGLAAGESVHVQGTRREPLLETDPGEELVLNLSAAAMVGGHLTYVEALRRE